VKGEKRKEGELEKVGGVKADDLCTTEARIRYKFEIPNQVVIVLV